MGLLTSREYKAGKYGGYLVEPFDDEQLLAFLTVTRFAYLEQNSIERLTQDTFCTDYLHFNDTAFFKNVMGGRQKGRNNKDNALLKFERLVSCVQTFFDGRQKVMPPLPEYILDAWATAFPDETKTEEIDEEAARAAQEIANVFMKLQLQDFRPRNKQLIKALNNRIYNIYRWAGPSDNDPEERVVKSVVNFRLHRFRSTLMTFNLKYRSIDPTLPIYKGVKAHTGWGVVVPVGSHFMLVGVESREHYPLLVMVQIDFENDDRFGGIVLRKADTKGQIITSRVVFSEPKMSASPSDEELRMEFEKLSAQAGIYARDGFDEKVLSLLEQFRNAPANGGKQALSLKAAT